MPLDLTVVLTTRRRSVGLAETLASFRRLHVVGLRWEVLVVDNSDGDPATHAVVEKLGGDLPLRLLVEPRRGTNHGRNRAVEEARSPFLVFTDDDVEPDAAWLAELCAGAARWPDARVFGGRVLPRWPADVAAPPPHSLFENAYAIADWAQPEGPYSAHRVFGPNMAYRASVFEEGWRFDPRFGPDGSDTYVTGSETNLNLALERAGTVPVYLPAAVVHHRVRREQLAPAWLYRRAFRLGRWEAHLAGVSGRPPGALSGLLRDLRRAYARFVVARLRRDRAGALEAGLVYWHARGTLHQWRRGLPAAPRGAQPSAGGTSVR